MLEVSNLRTYFDTEEGLVRAVDGVSFDVHSGEIVGIVGESGSGKSVTARSILRLINGTPGILEGSGVRFRGKNVLEGSEREMRKLRGNEIAMIFQEPMASLDPSFTIGHQIRESLHLHTDLGRRDARDRAIELLEEVGISSPEKRVDEYPHQLSGGMQQRAMIAIALSCQPEILVADEPTTALDVTIQAQILELLKRLNKKFNMTVILISHDLGVISDIVDRVLVMYAGQIVEEASIYELFDSPLHPYTEALLKSTPRLDEATSNLEYIEGSAPDPANRPPGCSFAPRCSYDRWICERDEPELVEWDESRRVRCWIHQLRQESDNRRTEKLEWDDGLLEQRRSRRADSASSG